MLKNCCHCTARFQNDLALLRHLRAIHLHETSFKCLEIDCFRSFPLWESFRSHMNKFHRISKQNSDSIENENITNDYHVGNTFKTDVTSCERNENIFNRDGDEDIYNTSVNDESVSYASDSDEKSS